MEKREAAKRDALELLQSIKTTDDLKEHREEVLNLIEDIFKYGIETLKDFFEGSLSQEASQDDIARFQDEEYFFDRSIERELDRIADLPGMEEYFASFKEELEGRIQPHLEEFALEMAKSMANLMGGMMEGFGEVFSDLAQEPQEILINGHPKRAHELYLLYKVQSIEDLELYKDDIIETLVEHLGSDLGELEDIKAVDFPLEEVEDRLEDIGSRKTRIVSQLDSEFERIGSISDIGELAGSVKENISKKIDPLLGKIDELLIEIRKK